MKRLTIAQMENVAGGNIGTLSACFSAMYETNQAMGDLLNAKTEDDFAKASFRLLGSLATSQKSCGEL